MVKIYFQYGAQFSSTTFLSKGNKLGVLLMCLKLTLICFIFGTWKTLLKCNYDKNTLIYFHVVGKSFRNGFRLLYDYYLVYIPPFLIYICMLIRKVKLGNNGSESWSWTFETASDMGSSVNTESDDEVTDIKKNKEICWMTSLWKDWNLWIIWFW